MGEVIDGLAIVASSLLCMTFCTGLVLSSSNTFASEVVDDFSISVPISCTSSSSGMTSHNTSIMNGTYESEIGTTTMHFYCNDNAGFSIYAAGYTGDSIGEENSNKLMGINSNNSTIATGTNTGPINNNDISSWAMKLATDSTATYPLTITSDINGSFANYHIVPNEYTKVATRVSGTDAGTDAIGATLTSTYATYISRSQPADTYVGRVIYTLVHPSTATAPNPPALEPCPNNEPCLRIVVPPNKIVYEEEEPIDITGIVVYLYDGDGTPIKPIPNNELDVIPSFASSEPAISSQYGVRIYDKDTYLGWVNDRTYYKANDGTAIAMFRNGSAYYGNWMGAVLFALSSEASQIRSSAGMSTTESFNYHGITLHVCHGYAYPTTNGDSPLPKFIPSGSINTWADLAEELGITVGSNVVTLPWENPDTGKILQTSYAITINE